MTTNPFLSPPSSPISTSSWPETGSVDLNTLPEMQSSNNHTARSTSSTAIEHPLPKPSGNRSRSQSQDSVILASRRTKSPKKGSSMHADIIDRLDFTGVGAAMFHHDGPFDACAPSRNRHRTKAPMLAWSSQDDSGLSDPALSPELKTPGSPYPPFEPKGPPRISSDFVGSGRLGDALPKKRTDALAEAWGVAEPEPFEEFFAGGGSGRASAASSVRAGAEGHIMRRGREVKADSSNEKPRLTSRRTTQRAPPPKPIAVPGIYSESDGPLSSEPESPGAKRSRSLMQRIRRMKENPNIPVSSEAELTVPPSKSSSTPISEKSRPTHRPHNSFLGRFSRSPNTPTFENQPFPPFSENTVIDGVVKEKQLPKLPGSPVSPGIASGGEGYFDQRSESGEAGPGAAIGRRTSLMRKVVNGVKRNAKN